MIIPFIYDLYEYDRISPKILAIFYKYANFCFKYNYPIIAQEKFFKKPSKYKEKGHWATSKDAELVHKYKVPSDSEIKELKKYILPKQLDKVIVKKYNSELEAAEKMMVNIDKDLVKEIEKIIKIILKNDRIEAFLTWIWSPSLSYVAKKYNIPVIQMEISSIRLPNYRENTGYFKFENKYDNKDINKLFSEFTQKQRILDRKEILALFLDDKKLYKIKKMNNYPEYEIGYALGLSNDLFEKNYSNVKTEEVANKLEEVYNSNDVVFRYHPADITENKKRYNFVEDKSPNSDEFILNCKRIICNISNIGYEANLYGRTVISLSKAIATSFNKVDSNFKKEEIMSLEKLNFLTFYYFTPHDLMFDIEYIKWRLTDPTVDEIYNYNLNYILKKYNINNIFEIKPASRYEYILKKTRRLTSDELAWYTNTNYGKVNIQLLNLIPGKSLRRKIINKCKFSNRLNKLFLGRMNDYEIADSYSTEIVKPILYSTNKIAININCKYNKKQLTKFLNKILFEFDLYVEGKLNIKNTFLNKIYKCNLLEKASKLKNYDYVLNINDFSEINIFEYGFFESCLSLLMSNNTDFINIGKNNINLKNIKNINPVNYSEFINSNTNVENLFYNDNICIQNIEMFNTRVINEELIREISKINMWNSSKKNLLLKEIYISSNKKIKYINKFKDDNFIPKSKKDIYNISANELYDELKKYETISFDIFDTLITRTILNPDDLFNLIDKKSKVKLNDSFLKIRKNAEILANSKLKKDVNIDEIYQFMQKENNLSEEDIEYLKDLEYKLEYDNLIPRTDMVKLYNKLLREGKNIDIISDMYLPKKFIVKVLEKCGIKKWRNIYISCDTGLRKDKGNMWDYYYNNNTENTIHIGDNYYSDYLAVLKKGRPAIKILNSKDFLNSYCEIMIKNEEDTFGLGALYNAWIFNSPFFNVNEIENKLELYGKYFLAPIMNTFFDWFTENNELDEILFVSREGYYLQKIYKEYCKKNNIKEIPNNYFLTSRRAVSFASCTSINDLYEISELEFRGSISDFFRKRFSFELKTKILN